MVKRICLFITSVPCSLGKLAVAELPGGMAVWVYLLWADGHVCRGVALRYYKWQEVYRPEVDMCHLKAALGSREQPQR